MPSADDSPTSYDHGDPARAGGLDGLRAKLNSERIDYAELVILGARAKARRLPEGGNTEEARRARKVLAEWIRNGNPGMVDIAAAEEVKHRGLIADYDV